MSTLEYSPSSWVAMPSMNSVAVSACAAIVPHLAFVVGIGRAVRPALDDRARVGDILPTASVGRSAGSAARKLHAEALRLEPGRDLLAVVALELDRTGLDRAARAALPLQVGADRRRLAGRKAADDGDGLAATAALLAEHADDAVVRELRAARRLLRARITRPSVAAVRRIDEPAPCHQKSLGRDDAGVALVADELDDCDLPLLTGLAVLELHLPGLDAHRVEAAHAQHATSDRHQLADGHLAHQAGVPPTARRPSTRVAACGRGEHD